MNTRKIKEILETKIDALILAGQTTIYEPLRTEIAHQINTYNLLYRNKFNKVYIPK